MDQKLKKLESDVNQALKEMEIIVSDINIREEKKYKFLTIELDKIGGIDLDTIVKATEVINPIVDKHDLIDEYYILDVVSKVKGDDYNE